MGERDDAHGGGEPPTRPDRLTPAWLQMSHTSTWRVIYLYLQEYRDLTCTGLAVEMQSEAIRDTEMLPARPAS
jgi:hypothetical protein